MRAARQSLTLLTVVVAVFALTAQGQTQEERRRALQERLGIKPGTQPRPAPDAGVAPVDEAPATTTAEQPAPAPGATGTPSATSAAPRPKTPRTPTFADVRPVLVKECESCHSADGKAKKSKWILTGAASDYDATLKFVKLDTPAQSALLRKGTGATLHGGKKTIAPDSAAYASLLQWIEGGAQRGRLEDAPATAEAPAPATTPATTATTPSPTQPGATPAATAQAPTADGGTPPTPTEQVAASGDAAAQPPASTQAAAPAGPRFAPDLHAQLLDGCASCHSADGMAASTRYLTDEDPQKHLQAVRALVVPGNSAQSLMYQRARGENHEPGAVWEPGSAELTRLAEWIDAGAEAPAVAAAGPAPVAAPGPTASAPPPAATSPHGPPAGMSLGTFPVLGSLRLNGRFDLNYERLGYNDHPFQSRGANALRSYHQFLFLTRESKDDPVTLSLEALSLQFWEVGMRISREGWPVKVHARLGKILVPFGGDPLFHHSYGGHAGFDQKVLPVVFAREGVTVNVQRRVGPVLLSGDAYLIAGYRLRRADAVLNLQSDFAPLEETRPGFGARLAASWGPISAYYSPYYNVLGNGRQLFLQALDVSVWRPRGIPVADRFSLGLGLLRADVSGGEALGFGGRGDDYYHFASYLQLRYYPLEWLSVQYRQGLRTFNNRRGLYLDVTDLTREDGSTHNLGVTARWRGLSCGLFHYWNMEKADEAADDFTRLVVAYEF